MESVNNQGVVPIARTTDLLDLFRFAAHRRFDPVTPFCIFLLSIIGVFSIYSAQVATGQTQYLNQIVWLILGGAVYLLVSLVDYKVFLKHSHIIYLISIVTLLLLWTPMGEVRGGSRRWLDFGLMSFQPAEAGKIGALLISASILARSEIGGVQDSLAVLAKLALAVCIPIILILAQPDLGSAIVIPPMVFSLLYVSKLSQRFFAAALGLFCVLLAIVAFDTHRYSKFLEENNLNPTTNRGAYEPHSWLPLRDYQRNRILSFVAPERIDPMGIGWNLRQSLISVGSGGLTGKGWTEGTQAKLGYLPRGVAHNDFIFSVLAEEKGFLGSISVLTLFGVVLFNGVRIAGMARDRFGTLLALGVTAIFAVHVFINIAMTIGLVPITGIPLPFLSYGGSFILGCCLLQGLVQSVYRYRKEF